MNMNRNQIEGRTRQRRVWLLPKPWLQPPPQGAVSSDPVGASATRTALYTSDRRWPAKPISDQDYRATALIASFLTLFSLPYVNIYRPLTKASINPGLKARALRFGAFSPGKTRSPQKCEMFDRVQWRTRQGQTFRTSKHRGKWAESPTAQRPGLQPWYNIDF